MARAKKYRTKSELKEANRLKNKRHYERNKEEILKRRREKRAKEKAREARKRARIERKSLAKSPNQVVGSVDSSVRGALKKAQDAYERFQQAIERNPRKHTLGICQRVFSDFETGKPTEALRTFVASHSEAFVPLREAILVQYNEILQFRGVSREISQLDRMLSEIDTVQGWVDDVETYLFNGVDDLTRAFHSQELLFQKEAL
ncbi:hypothetical protein CC2G_012415 [Coprinopsis cinerea AmutBmut pab1-1]|nr:hypothetical protein CC2G_012415 [Coprinopsis cinerea AmutBmut pab1-1]